MKKINSKILIITLIIIFTLVLSATLIGCTHVASENSNSTNYFIYVQGCPEASFIYLYSKPADDVYIVYNEKTKVMYAVSNGNYNRGIFVELKNADGTLLTYDEGETK